MKNCRAIVLLTAFLVCSIPSFSQNQNELSPGYYVVVGAYAKSREAVAKDYVALLNQKGIAAEYGFNSSRKLYLVYLNYYTSLKESLNDMARTRREGRFKDAWVRVVHGDIQTQPATASAPVQRDTAPASPATPATPQAPATTTAKPLEPAPEPPPSDQPEVEVAATDDIEVTDNPEIVQYKKMTLGNTEVFLSLYNARNNRIVDGDVQVVDAERSRLITRVKGNEYLVLPDPKSKSGQLTLICEAFGYRKVQQEINYPLPLADTVKPNIDLMGTTLVVNFDLVRYHKGDIATLYNVYFFNDAAIMLPESKYELNSLLHLMQENPRYRIRLHGHTNGNYSGKILSLGADKNFFSREGAKQSSGSAKDLSYERANTIKEYLVANGIAADRMEIKAWGGRRPLYDKRSANAKKNVRVEVEILEE